MSLGTDGKYCYGCGAEPDISGKVNHSHGCAGAKYGDILVQEVALGEQPKCDCPLIPASGQVKPDKCILQKDHAGGHYPSVEVAEPTPSELLAKTEGRDEWARMKEANNKLGDAIKEGAQRTRTKLASLTESNAKPSISPEQDFAEFKPDAWVQTTFSDETIAEMEKQDAVKDDEYKPRYDLIPPDAWVQTTFSNETIAAIEKQDAVKHDEYKPRYDLIPPDALDAVAEVLKYGAVKYGDRNWEKGLAWHRLYRAALGHMFAFWSGEYFDQESKLPHIWHAACCILMLVSTVKRFKELDDRPRAATGDPNSNATNDTMPGSQQEQRVDASTQTG